jgi:hypothetical protein
MRTVGSGEARPAQVARSKSSYIVAALFSRHAVVFWTSARDGSSSPVGVSSTY